MIENRLPLIDVLGLRQENKQNVLEEWFFFKKNPLGKRFVNTSVLFLILYSWFTISTAIAGASEVAGMNKLIHRSTRNLAGTLCTVANGVDKSRGSGLSGQRACMTV